MCTFLEDFTNAIAHTSCRMTDQGLDNMSELVEFSESDMKTLKKILGTQEVQLITQERRILGSLLSFQFPATLSQR